MRKLLFLLLFLFLFSSCSQQQNQASQTETTTVDTSSIETYTGDLYIIDIHAHINPTDEEENDQYLEELIEIAEKEGVSTIALGLHARHIMDQPPVYSEEHDTWVLAAAETYPNIIIPFLDGFDPADLDAPTYVEEHVVQLLS
ncbi:hypothetical protein EXS74_03425 [Candidatus Woesearchaeota archaeon]|nr:hypothetical protein [Candidatus Woesearchaeota archaeon]